MPLAVTAGGMTADYFRKLCSTVCGTGHTISARSAIDYTIRAHLPGHYDEGLHSIDYLMYAMLQTARDEQAKQLLDQLGSIGMTDTENVNAACTYAASSARYALERRQWQEAADLALIRGDFPWDDFRWAQSIHHFARGIGAARSRWIHADKDCECRASCAKCRKFHTLKGGGLSLPLA